MAEFKIGNFAMRDAVRMIPESWLYCMETQVFVKTNGEIRLEKGSYNFCIEGDGIVSVTHAAYVGKKSYDDHAYYANVPGKKFLEICKEKFDEDVHHEVLVEAVTQMRSEAVEHVMELCNMDVITVEQRDAMIQNLRSNQWFRAQYEKIVKEEEEG